MSEINSDRAGREGQQKTGCPVARRAFTVRPPQFHHRNLHHNSRDTLGRISQTGNSYSSPRGAAGGGGVGVGEWLNNMSTFIRDTFSGDLFMFLLWIWKLIRAAFFHLLSIVSDDQPGPALVHPPSSVLVVVNVSGIRNHSRKLWPIMINIYSNPIRPDDHYGHHREFADRPTDR